MANETNGTAGGRVGLAKWFALLVGIFGVIAFVVLDRRLAPDKLNAYIPSPVKPTNTIEMTTNSPGNWATNR